MIILKALAALITLAGLGWAVRSLVLPKVPGLNPVEKLSLSWLLGFAYLGWLVDLSLVLLHRVHPWIWAASFVIVPIAGARHHRTIRSGFSGGWRRSRWRLSLPSPVTFLLSCILVWQTAYVLAYSLSAPLGPDGMSVWAMKAKAIHFDSTSMPGTMIDYFKAPTWEYTHNYYPLTLPAVEAWVFAWVGGINEQAAKLISPLCFIALLTLLTCSLRRSLPAKHALLLVCLIATSWLIVYFSALGYADIALAAVFGGAAAFGAEALRQRDEKVETIALVLAACAPLVKREGWLLAFLLLGYLFVLQLTSNGLSDVSRLLKKTLPILALILGPRLLLQVIIPPVYGDDFAPPSWLLFMANRERMGQLAQLLLSILGNREVYGFLWYVLGGFLLVGLAFWRRREMFFLGGICLTYLALMAASFIFSIWPDYLAHAASLDRIVLQVAPVGILFAGYLWAVILESGHGSDKKHIADRPAQD